MNITADSMLIAIALAIPFAFFAWYKKWLDVGGAIAAALFGILLWVVGGWATTGPALIFFITGSLLGTLPQKGITDAKHHKPRDWVQVVANGGIAGLAVLLYVFYPSPALQMVFWVSIATSTSDTWSSGIGQWAGGKVWDIVGFRPLAAGLSGGVSVQGTFGGLLGSLVIALATKGFAGISWSLVGLIAVTGFAGMLVDSILGSLFQGVYRLPDGQLTEDRAAAGSELPTKGLAWMTNDMVNLLSNLLIALLVGVLAFFAAKG
ncbi:MAG TPA: DUF92 domain-containing protein [Phnomibacter sp.]|nr:DUF92 domain-containing protein [Phnomibacter sp.]